MMVVIRLGFWPEPVPIVDLPFQDDPFWAILQMARPHISYVFKLVRFFFRAFLYSLLFFYGVLNGTRHETKWRAKLMPAISINMDAIADIVGLLK